MTQDFQRIRREDRPGGICVLTFDRPGSSANLFDPDTLAELGSHLDNLQRETGLRGIVFRSAKPRVFLAGADLRQFSGSLRSEDLGAFVDLGQEVFNRVVALRVPTAAAIHGACLGGGFELALACDWRAASDDGATRIGFPEVTLGLLPAWGGCTRLPRLAGLPRALAAILTGKSYRARHARKLGFVDVVAPPEHVVEAAARLVARGKRPRSRRSFLSWAPLKRTVVKRAREKVLTRTRGLYPAPERALEVVAAGLDGPEKSSLERERAALLDLAFTPEAGNLVRIFHLRDRARKTSVPAEIAARPAIRVARDPQRVAVIGAGLMGSGIAHWLSTRGLDVLLCDVDAAPLARGMSRVARRYREAVDRRLLCSHEARRGLDRITPVVGEVPLRTMDLVIEAATEKLDVKQEIFRKLETRCAERTILATNTSALSIDEIGRDLGRPERLVGMHFFNPVHQMQLVEVACGSRTAPEAVGLVLQTAKRIGKLPVIVRNQPGFLVNRILMPYLLEAVRMFEEGHSPMSIDQQMLAFGMPMGPLRLIDEIGLDTALHVARNLKARLPGFGRLPEALEGMAARGWRGHKSGLGFFDYGKARGFVENEQACRALNRAVPPRSSPVDLRDRLVLLMVNEAHRCLAELVVPGADEIDFGMITGTGWAPFRGGPLRYADARGPTEVARRLEELARIHGAHYEPCGLLREKAAEKGSNPTF